MPHSSPFHYVLTETESAKRYLLTQAGHKWEKEFTTVAAAYFFARSLSEAGEGRLVVLNEAGEECTLFLF